MKNQNLIDRTKKFCVRIVSLTNHLPESRSAIVIANQILRSATSVGANYRAACFAKSQRDFINKLKIVEEETDETIFWLELIEECNLIEATKLIDLKKETKELLAIFISSIKTAKSNCKK